MTEYSQSERKEEIPIYRLYVELDCRLSSLILSKTALSLIKNRINNLIPLDLTIRNLVLANDEIGQRLVCDIENFDLDKFLSEKIKQMQPPASDFLRLISSRTSNESKIIFLDNIFGWINENNLAQPIVDYCIDYMRKRNENGRTAFKVLDLLDIRVKSLGIE